MKLELKLEIWGAESSLQIPWFLGKRKTLAKVEAAGLEGVAKLARVVSQEEGVLNLATKKVYWAATVQKRICLVPT